MTLYIVTLIINKIMAPIIEGYMIVTICEALLNRRYKYKHIDIIIIIEFAIAIQVVSELNISKNIVSLALMNIIAVVIIQYNYIGTIFKKVLCYTLFLFIVIICESITAILLVTITDLNLSVFYTSSYYYSWGVIISKTIELIFLKLFVNRLRKNKINIKKSYIIETLLLQLISLTGLFALTEYIQNNTINNNYIIKSSAIILSLLAVIIPCLILYVLNRIINATKKEVEQKQLIQQYKIEHIYTQELNKVLDNLRILKHDLKNHISCMWGLIETDNIEDFKCYLTNLTNEIEELNENEIAQNFDIENT